MEKILIVDDDMFIRQMTKRALEMEGYQITEAESGEKAEKILKILSFDLIILDVMLEDTNGLDLIKKIQSQGINTPIIFLSGKSQEHDKILGLGLGADDYITKPFSPILLNARVKAHLRRYKKFREISLNEKKIIQGPFIFDINSYKLYKNGEELNLSSKELLLMKFLMQNPDTVLTKDEMYENVWSDIIIDNNAIMVYIRRLRKKIELNPDEPQYLKTVWGIGYRFSV